MHSTLGTRWQKVELWGFHESSQLLDSGGVKLAAAGTTLPMQIRRGKKGTRAPVIGSAIGFSDQRPPVPTTSTSTTPTVRQK